MTFTAVDILNHSYKFWTPRTSFALDHYFIHTTNSEDF